jgi:hypothetical protein
MLLYRGFLLQDFMNRMSDIAMVPVPSELGQKCRDAAISMAELAAELASDETYNPVFWVLTLKLLSKLPRYMLKYSQGTSHFIFCSIAILVVSLLIYNDRSRLEAVIESGMKAHTKLSISGNTHIEKLLEVFFTKFAPHSIKYNGLHVAGI